MPSGIERGRAQIVRIDHGERRPLRAINMYGYANDKEATKILVTKLCEHAVKLGDPFIMIGDWNLTPDEAPLTWWQATGVMRLAD
eukprot:12189822-Karenia_brevis.AAC.1